MENNAFVPETYCGHLLFVSNTRNDKNVSALKGSGPFRAEASWVSFRICSMQIAMYRCEHICEWHFPAAPWRLEISVTLMYKLLPGDKR